MSAFVLGCPRAHFRLDYTTAAGSTSFAGVNKVIRGCIREPAFFSFKSGQDDLACLIYTFSLSMTALLRGTHFCNAKS